MSVDWKWVVWQFLMPVFAPIIISSIVVILWSTGNPAFQPRFSVIIDVSPWALTFYSLTLICSTLHEMRGRLASCGDLCIALMFDAAAVFLYASFMVIWRHDPKFIQGHRFMGLRLFSCFSRLFCVITAISYQKK